ncbi:MAG TPA: Ig-like domain-containing protein, partial [Kofleriaceae bacterium]|nr:Ig-like domain-containing protein [Kofleriaceae bacterium]
MSLGWLLVVGLAACGDNAAKGPPAVVLEAVSISPPAPALPVGMTLQLTATGSFSDATTSDVSKAATWSSSDKAVATVSATGVVTGVSAGSATITASFSGVTGSTSVTITAATLQTLEVTPTDPSVPAGITQQLIAMGMFSDGSKLDLTTLVTWSSDDTAHVTVSATGLVKAVAKGSATITASLGVVSGMTTIQATDATLSSIKIAPNPAKVALGRTLRLTATGIFSDATHQDLTTQVTWSSGTTDHATIDAGGELTTVAVGGTTVTASFGSGAAAVTGTLDVEVSAAELESIKVDPVASVAAGRTAQFKATGKFSDQSEQNITTQVDWSSSDNTVAQISNAADASKGLATTFKPGAVTVTARASTPGGPVVDGSTEFTVTDALLVSIELSPVAQRVAKGRTQQFTATGTFSNQDIRDVTKDAQVNWASSNETIAKVSNAAPTQGFATTLGEGDATITASAVVEGVTISGSTTLKVTEAVLDSIAVTPQDPSVAAGLAQPFVAIGTFSDTSHADLTKEVTWTSSDDLVASISNLPDSEGIATTHKVGQVTITATKGAISGISILTVTDAILVGIEVNPPVKSIAAGTVQEFAALGRLSDGSATDLTSQVIWSSDPVEVATISAAGVATAVTPGDATITATKGTVSGHAALTVTNAAVVSIQLEPIAPSLPAGRTLRFKAVGTFSDQSSQDVTALATWSSTDDQIATVSNASGERGLTTAVQAGHVDISAVFDGQTGITTLTVTEAVLERIDVTPATPSLPLGRTLGFTATGQFSDHRPRDLTAAVTWASSADAIATISNAADHGIATAHSTGQTTISASLDGTTGSTLLTVTGAVLDSIEVAPADASLAKGRTQQFAAQGTFSDNSHQDLTEQVVWTSTTTTVAQITSGVGGGKATALGDGQTTISAALNGKLGSATLTVTRAVLDSIVVTPATVSLAKGHTQQFTARGTFSDTTTLDVTTQVTWGSDATTIVQITSTGLATALDLGSTQVTAALDGVSGGASVTVTAPVLDTVVVTPSSAAVLITQTQDFHATGTLSDGASVDLTTTATWTATPVTTASVLGTGVATGLAVGTATITATSNGVAGTASLNVSVPVSVNLALPRDGTTGNRLTTAIVVVFSGAITPASLTAQATDGPCTGAFQVSTDDFASCIGFTGNPAMTSGNTVATATPAQPLQPVTTHRIRVLGTVKNAAGAPSGVDFTQATGFTSGTGSTCASGLVISQVYGGGGNTGAQFKNDFIELHNGGATPVSLAGLAVQFTSQQ